jgi:hypothetical protein
MGGRAGKAFSGCWTCRERRVKCDEGLPNCKRCDTAGITCQGYSIRLVWKGPPDSSKGRRRSRDTKPKYSHRSKMLPIQAVSPSALSRAEVFSIQHDLETVQFNPSSSSKGLFSVFRSQPRAVGSAGDEGSGSSSSCLNSSTPVTDNSIPSPANDDSAGSTLYDNNTPDATNLDVDQNTQASITTREGQLDEAFNWQATRDENETCSDDFLPDIPSVFDQSGKSPYVPILSDRRPSSLSSTDYLTSLADDLSYDLDFSLMPQKDWEIQLPSDLNSQVAYLRREQKLPRTPHIDLLPAPAEQKELIHHWITSLSLGMLPVARIDKPQHNMFVPIALAGLNSDFQESSGEVAVFHGLCAASAFNISELKGYDCHFHQLATKHRQLALHHLRHCMQGDRRKNESVWAGIMTLVFQAGVLGQAYEWRAHVKGLGHLIVANSHIIRKSHVARGIYETYLCLAILGNIQTDVDLRPLLTEIPPDLDYVGSVHGITRPILEMVLKINSLASAKTFLSRTELDRLELQLLLSSPGNTSTGALDDSAANLLLNYSYVYYYAALIHFHRVLGDKAPDLLQDLVERAIGHLEASETAGRQPKGCIWVWPCLVVSAECTIPQLQSRMLAWYEVKRRHGFKNLEVACNIASEVWARRLLRPADLGDLCWQDLIDGTEYDVLPL